MKAFLWVAFAFLAVGTAGFLYRSAAEHPNEQIACPLDARVCPDGTTVARSGASCTFAACPPPNVTLSDVGISYAVPEGFEATALPDSASVAAYDSLIASSSNQSSIVVRAYAVDASSTPLATIESTAIGATSGAPLPATAFSSLLLGQDHRFTVVTIEQFEGVIDTAYYFALGDGSKVVRFDAIDGGVADWSDPNLNISHLPAHAALFKLLGTLSGA